VSYAPLHFRVTAGGDQAPAVSGVYRRSTW